MQNVDSISQGSSFGWFAKALAFSWLEMHTKVVYYKWRYVCRILLLVGHMKFILVGLALIVGPLTIERERSWALMLALSMCIITFRIKSKFFDIENFMALGLYNVKQA